MNSPLFFYQQILFLILLCLTNLRMLVALSLVTHLSLVFSVKTQKVPGCWIYNIRADDASWYFLTRWSEIYFDKGDAAEIPYLQLHHWSSWTGSQEMRRDQDCWLLSQIPPSPLCQISFADSIFNFEMTTSISMCPLKLTNIHVKDFEWHHQGKASMIK